MDAAITLKSTQGLALVGIVTRKHRHEAFVTGAIVGDNLTLVYGSQRYERLTPRKVQRVNVTRFVQCERRFTPDGGDFVWHGTGQTILSHTSG